MKWLHPVGSVRAWLRWRERILIEQEDAAIRAARDEARTPDEREFVDRVLEERERSRRAAPHDQR